MSVKGLPQDLILGEEAVGEEKEGGVADSRWGEAVVAVVELKQHGVADEASLRNELRDRLAGYKVPKRIVFVDRLQRSPNGKSDYRWAKEYATSSCAQN